jgi:Flp pilus assembly protein TadB
MTIISLSPELLIAIAFLACAVTGAMLMLLVRRLWNRRRNLIEQRLKDDRPEPKLARLPLSVDQAPPRGPIGRFDHWFNQLVGESGWSSTPQSAFTMALVAGCLLAGGLLLFQWWQDGYSNSAKNRPGSNVQSQTRPANARPNAEPQSRWRLSNQWSWFDDAVSVCTGLLIGMGAFVGYLVYLRARRRAAMQEQLPDVMELLARAVRAGESLDQAIALAGETAGKPLGPEFRRCAAQLEMGLSVDAAMRGLARRAPLGEMRIFAATLMVQRQTGGKLPVTLERLGKVIRDRISYHRQFRAATGASRVSTILIAIAGPLVAAYLLVWQRTYILHFTESFAGQMLLLTALVLQAVGLLWIYRLLRTDY